MDPNFRADWSEFSGQYLSTQSFSDQTFSDYNDGLCGGVDIPSQQPHGSYGMSNTAQSFHNRQSQDESLGLSSFDAAARDNVHNVPFRNLIKSEQVEPWVGHQQTASQNRSIPHPRPSTAYAQSEPSRKRVKTSECADSGYQTQYIPVPVPNQNTLSWNKQEPEHSHHQFQGSPPCNSNIDNRSCFSDGRLLFAGAKDARKKPQLLPCAWRGCGHMPKNPSDAKKHELTHTKPFICQEQVCNGKGFATENDLQRHRKGVHSLQPTVGSEIGYICVACTIPEGASPKFWPRKDNFKAHIKRKHPTYDEKRLMKKSEQPIRPDDSQTACDDARTVLSALPLAAPRSQADMDDMGEYQHLHSSPCLSRHASEQDRNIDNLWPDSNPPVFGPDDMLAGMEAHILDPSYPNLAMNVTGFDNFDTAINPAADYGFQYDPSDPGSAFKKPSLSPFPSGVGESDHGDSEQRMSFPETQSSSSYSGTQPEANNPGLTGEFVCRECQKSTRRECDLKKHMKRHTRPYGCTFPNCQKRFGSRNDWRRHETSQHFLQEMWKCQRKRIDGAECVRRPFHEVGRLKQHLRGPHHQMQDEAEIDLRCREFRLGRNGYDHFWCGFCNCLISQDRDLQNAPYERFKHIGDHFDKDGRDIGDWVCIDKNKPKQLITQEERKETKRRARNGFREEEEDDFNPESLY